MSSTTRIVGVGTVGVQVTDQDRALEFYVGKLGFETRRDMPFGGGRWIEVAPPGSATTIALVPEGVPAGIRLMTTDADGSDAGDAGRAAHGASSWWWSLTKGSEPPGYARHDRVGFPAS